MVNKILLEVAALSESIASTGSYTVVLSEVSGNRRLPVVIGSFEAQAIHIKLANIQTPRPLTHDLLVNLIQCLDTEIEEVLIVDIKEGVFYAKIQIRKGIETISLDARTSDAIALAVRAECPIFVAEYVLDEAGIVVEDERETAAKNKKKINSNKTKTIEDLELDLAKALGKENYEKAAKIRDEIKKRDKN